MTCVDQDVPGAVFSFVAICVVQWSFNQVHEETGEKCRSGWPLPHRQISHSGKDMDRGWLWRERGCGNGESTQG